MNNNNYWYNIKEENGSILIEKTIKEEKTETNNYFLSKNKKNNWRPVFFVLPIILLLPFFVMIFLNSISSNNGNSKYRTFMIYMVGSDLESSGKIATYDLNDIKGTNIDLNNNNILLMVGGSKKWHNNYVNEDEVGLFELTKSGFKKVKKFKLSSMGYTDTLYNFIDYTTSHYNSEKYDMIFWNHGLGALGLEVDEVFDDFLDIKELKSVFDKTKFSKEKLELVIFNNCLAGNIHFASIMKEYANYMVASEEVMYVGGIIDRLNFLNDVKKNDNGYDIGLAYVKKSDSSINLANKINGIDLDSTLSIIDLSKIEEVEKNMNKYFDSIDLESNYKNVSRARRKTTTYGDTDLSYDTVDLYTLADSLGSVSNNELKEALQESIKKAVVHNSALNEYSNGLSVYFPYYGDNEFITSHLYYFDKIWNNEYTNFIHNYYDLSTKAKRANRIGKENDVLKLSNIIKYEDNKISLELTEEENNAYQSANIYVFEKSNNKYKLITKSDEIYLENNKLISKDLVLLKTFNNEIISSIKENNIYKIYGLLSGNDVVIKVKNNKGYGSISNVLIDSKDKPVGGLIDYSDEPITYYSLVYNNLNEKLSEDWNTNIQKVKLNNEDNNISLVGNDLTNYYVLIELFDINNDVFYSDLTQIK